MIVSIFEAIFNWKTILALGGAVSCVILAKKITPDDAKEAFSHAADASKEWRSAIASSACS